MTRPAKTRSISMAEKDWRAAQELANSNFQGNVSELLRTLVHFATMRASNFDLKNPTTEATDNERGEEPTFTMSFIAKQQERILQ